MINIVTLISIFIQQGINFIIILNWVSLVVNMIFLTLVLLIEKMLIDLFVLFFLHLNIIKAYIKVIDFHLIIKLRFIFLKIFLIFFISGYNID